MNQNRQARFAFSILILIFLVAVALRTFAASEFLWLDELHTAWVAASDWSQIIDRAADGNQTPLYFFIVALLIKTLGATPVVLRSFSLFCGLLLWVTATQWTWRLTKRYVASILVAALIATDIQFVFYSAEARPYVLVQLLGLWHTMTFWSLWGDGSHKNALSEMSSEEIVSEEVTSEDERKRLRKTIATFVWFVLLSVALFYTHFTSVWVLAAEAIYLLERKLGRQRARKVRASTASLKDFLVCGLITVVLWLPGIWNCLNVYSRRGNWSNISSLDRLGQELFPWLSIWLFAPLMLMILLRIVRLTGRVKKNEDGAGGQWLLVFLAVVGITGPIAIAGMHVLEIAPMALIRYSAVGWVALAVFAGVSTSRFSFRWSVVVGVVILVASLWQNLLVIDCVTQRRWVPYRNENWHDPIWEISNGPNDTPVFQMGDVIEDVDALKIVDARFQTYLAFPVLGIDQIATNGAVDRDQEVIALPTFGERWTADYLEKIDAKGRAWLLVRGEEMLEIDVVEQLRSEFQATFAKQLEFQSGSFRGPNGNPIRLLRVRVAD